MICKGFLFCLISIVLHTCVSAPTSKKTTVIKEKIPGFYLEGQVLPPKEIKSVRLEHSVAIQAVPLIRLQSADKLTLRFDEITDHPHNYGVRFSRYSSKWEEDGLVPTQISGGQLEDLIELGDRSNDEFPSFFQFDYTFPNERIWFTLSGNWLVEVFTYQSGETVFSLPFLVSEQQGSIQVQTETLNEMNQQSRFQHQHFVFYSFSEKAVQLPEYNVSVYVIQDGRFSSQKQLPVKDFSNRSNQVIRYHHERSDLFVANYDHLLLNMKKLRDSQLIRYVEERGAKPPSVLLFDNNPVFEQTTAFQLVNKPSSDRFDRYAEVEFSLVPNWQREPNERVFVTCLFAQYGLKSEYEMAWNEQEQRFKRPILLKQGEYAYSYEVLRKGIPVPQLAQNPFGSTVRHYTVLVYYADPTRFIDRLVNVYEFSTR